jgi:hypothetical protein
MSDRDDAGWVCVGDTIITSTCFGESRFLITRVTKTLAMSKRESDGYEYKFKRRISYDMAHPRERWSTTNYKVIKEAS